MSLKLKSISSHLNLKIIGIFKMIRMIWFESSHLKDFHENHYNIIKIIQFVITRKFCSLIKIFVKHSIKFNY